MPKTRILGVVGLLGAVAIPLNYNIIINHNQVAAYNIFSQEALDDAIERAEEARDLAKANPSEVYPGLAEYMDRLINDVTTHDYENIDTVLAALDEASESIPYLLGLNQQTTKREVSNGGTRTYVTESAERTVAQTSEIRQAGVTQVESKAVETSRTEAKPVAETRVVAQAEVKNEAKAVEDTKNEEAQTKADESEEVAQTDTIELPNTGAPEEKKMSFVGLIIAGVAVIIMTVGASIAIIKSKKNS